MQQQQQSMQQTRLLQLHRQMQRRQPLWDGGWARQLRSSCRRAFMQRASWGRQARLQQWQQERMKLPSSWRGAEAVRARQLLQWRQLRRAALGVRRRHLPGSWRSLSWRWRRRPAPAAAAAAGAAATM
jgi:hypothetical protein